MMTEKKSKRGWHATQSKAPHKGKGTATVAPIRKISFIRKIAKNIKSHPRDYALFIFGIHSGLRGSDILNLKFRDILRDGKVKKVIRLTEQKTKKSIEFALSLKPRKALAALVPEESELLDMAALVFPGRNGKPMSIQRLHQLVCKWCEDAGLDENYGTHTLRKTWAYHMLRQGTRIDLVMEMLGHSAMSITLKYAGITKDETNKARLKLTL
jgi:integrase